MTRSRRSSLRCIASDCAYSPHAACAMRLQPRMRRKMLARNHVGLRRLPGSRDEVTAIARLFPGRSTTYFGTNATEARAQSLDRSAKYIHFAVHGILNARLPLDSSLALAVPTRASKDEGNGLLQAWEIFEHLRLNAELVTLSACETALGKEVSGDGLIGLTQAFLYAGARTVAASLWVVDDAATSHLMQRFYANIRAGQTKDEALQNAQRELIALGRRSTPSSALGRPAAWAAFVINGDWR